MRPTLFAALLNTCCTEGGQRGSEDTPQHLAVAGAQARGERSVEPAARVRRVSSRSRLVHHRPPGLEDSLQILHNGSGAEIAVVHTNDLAPALFGHRVD